MPLALHNDALDDTPATAGSNGWSGADLATAPALLAPELVSDGENMLADESGRLATRPGLRWITLFHSGELSDPDRTAVQGLAYYDTPSAERVVAVRDGLLYECADDEFSTPATLVTGTPPTLSTTAQVAFAQLVDRLFYVAGTNALRWSQLASGAWTHGNVATFNGGAAMPTWGGIVAHQLRLFAWPADGSRLYASSIGQAHNAADWQQTDNLRFGMGEGDPIIAVESGMGANLLVFTQAAVYAVDTSAPTVAAWTITQVTRLAGCAAPRSVLAFGQDVLFLGRYGVLALGALADNVSIAPASAISAPVQPIIDRINWSRRDRIFATAWRDLYLLALPLDDDERPTVFLPFNVRTRRWQTPWRADLGAVPYGDIGAASLLAAEDGSLLVNQTPAAFQTTGTPPVSPLAVFVSDGWSAACISRFGGRTETLLADSTGRLLRIDPALEADDSTPSFAQAIVSWVNTKAYDFDTPEHPKQPFTTELTFEGSTATGVQLTLVPDGATAYPDVPLQDGLRVSTGFVTGTLGQFPFTLPIRFRPNGTNRKRWHIRAQPRFRHLALQLHSARGRLRLRSVRTAAFIDTPELTQS